MRGLGLGGKTNRCEGLSTSRNRKGAKDAVRHWPKWHCERFLPGICGRTDTTLTGIQGPSNPLESTCMELGKPVVTHTEVETLLQSRVMWRRVEDAGKSEGRAVMAWIGIASSDNIIPPERGQTSGGSECMSHFATRLRRCTR